ncbi:MAG TPA: hypothetical protein VGW10_04865, partial [Solirubrobacteraceae bacterium]|nr:hypothetical protein [Solirubrobacteraceae bacterium]
AVLRALSSDIGGRPFIVHGGGGTLYIAMNDYSGRRTLLWRSADDGANWSPPQQIYAWGGGTGHAEPLVGPQAGQLTFASSNPQTTAWGAALDGSESGTDARATLSESAVHDVQPALTGDGGAIVVANDLTNTFFHRLAPGGEPGNGAAWSGPTTIGAGDTSRVAGGPGGPYVLTSIPNTRQEIRKWNGSGFGAPVSVPERGSINDVVVSSSGGVGAIWRFDRDDGADMLRLALSTDGGATFPVRTIAVEAANTVMYDMAVGLAGDNAGFAVYGGQPGSNGARNLIRVVNTDPVDDGAPPAPPGQVPGPAGPAGPEPGDVVAPVQPRLVTKRTRGATLRLESTPACVRPGALFGARMSAKKDRRRRGRRVPFVRLTKAEFFIGRNKQVTDTAAPFTQRVRGPDLPSRRFFYLRVRVTIKRPAGVPSPKVFIQMRMTAC